MKLVDVSDALQAYLDGLVAPRDPLLARIENEAHRDGVPIVDPHEGALLYLLVRLAGGKRVLELGTATGYSGIWLMRGTDGGILTSYELDPKRAETARANFAEAGFSQRAIVLEENAVQGLEKLEGRFDVCFIDLLNSFRSEEITRRVLDLCLQHLDGGALLMADNALNQGNVLDPKSQGERNAAYYNDLVSKHPQLESVVVPIRDGLSVARVKD
jgi:caffeoyl-CoA O-methyltransferase